MEKDDIVNRLKKLMALGLIAGSPELAHAQRSIGIITPIETTTPVKAPSTWDKAGGRHPGSLINPTKAVSINEMLEQIRGPKPTTAPGGVDPSLADANFGNFENFDNWADFDNFENFDNFSNAVGDARIVGAEPELEGPNVRMPGGALINPVRDRLR